MGGGLSDQILAAAESDFEADSLGGVRKHLREVLRRRPVERKRKLRQQCRNKLGLARSQLVTLASAEKGAVAVLRHDLVAGYRHRHGRSIPGSTPGSAMTAQKIDQL